jgi:hypothetical protein
MSSLFPILQLTLRRLDASVNERIQEICTSTFAKGSILGSDLKLMESASEPNPKYWCTLACKWARSAQLTAC